jgi:hypothetical protein
MPATKPLRLFADPVVALTISVPLSVRMSLVHLAMAHGTSLSAIARDLITHGVRKSNAPQTSE